MKLRLGDLAAELALPLEGDPDRTVTGVASLEEAGPDDLVFARTSAMNEALAVCPAQAVVAGEDVDVGDRTALRSDDPGRDFFHAAGLLLPDPRPPAGVDSNATVHPEAEVDPSAAIGPHCAVGAGARVGARSVLHPGVVLYDNVEIGDDCVLHARCVVAGGSRVGDRVILQPGVVVGGDGFGYVGGSDGGLQKMPHVGRVRIEDDVEVGAGSTIDRGTLDDTVIGRGTKIDNLVQIAHNVRIGERCVVVSQAGIAGSTQLGNGVVVLAQAGLVGHIEVGDNAFIGPQSGVHKDVSEGARILGSPQRAERRFHREMAALGRLPELFRRVRNLERGDSEDS
ncbi:MAG: UDP-3-O-(3-hydroxymyristoyl)glucosamine N-acyltransferase [Myxococcota bacterium]